MSAIFPKWTNRLPAMIIAGSLLTGTAVVGGIWYYMTPKYTRVGYEPMQPVAFSHAMHAGQLGVDCRYCHNAVEKSWYSNIPASSTCMNCHNQVLKDDPRLALVRESAASGEPIPWVQVHACPISSISTIRSTSTAAISCVECHGQINHMDEVYHAKPLEHDFLPGLPSRPGGPTPAAGQDHGFGLEMERQRRRELEAADGPTGRESCTIGKSNPCKLFRPATDEHPRNQRLADPGA